MPGKRQSDPDNFPERHFLENNPLIHRLMFAVHEIKRLEGGNPAKAWEVLLHNGFDYIRYSDKKMILIIGGMGLISDTNPKMKLLNFNQLDQLINADRDDNGINIIPPDESFKEYMIPYVNIDIGEDPHTLLFLTIDTFLHMGDEEDFHLFRDIQNYLYNRD